MPSRSLHVLVIDEELPYPPNAGKRIRTWNLLRRLARRHAVDFLCYGNPDDSAISAVRSAGIQVHLVPPPPSFSNGRLYVRLFANLFSPYPYSVSKHYSRRYRNRLRQLLAEGRPDMIHCEWTPYARFLPTRGAARSLIATHNVESQVWFHRARYSQSLAERLFFALQGWKMRFFERRYLPRADHVTAVTVEDANRMRTWGVHAITLVPNGVDLKFFRPTAEPVRPQELLYLASLDWHPNVDALAYFLDEIMPIIHTHSLQVTLRIVGRRPAEALKRRVAALSWAELVGEVDDVRPHLARAAVVVVPLRIGGGSRIKVLEALAAGKAVVSTSVGAEGLAVVAGKHLHIANRADDFARRTLDLLASAEERRRLGENGRTLVAECYGWDCIAEALESAWFGVCRIDSSVRLTPAVTPSG